MRTNSYEECEITGRFFHSLKEFDSLIKECIKNSIINLCKKYSNVTFVGFDFYSTSDGDGDNKELYIQMTFERDETEKEIKEREIQTKLDEERRARYEREQMVLKLKQKEARKKQYLNLKEEFEGRFEESL